MRTMQVKLLFASVFFTAVCVLIAGCSKKQNNKLAEASSISSNLVFGGTVSHHSLADEYIDEFFNEIRKNRDVKTFFIICPSHYGLSTFDYSTADFTFKTQTKDFVFVKSNSKIVKDIAKKLNVGFDDQVFYVEHGILALIPFINKYFPEADVVPIAVTGEPPVNMEYVKKLSDVVAPYFSEEKRKDNFLVISSDFCHHKNIEETEKVDKRSKIFFDDIKTDNWFFCGCDNRPGIYVLANLFDENTELTYLYHTTSYEICHQQPEDVTSYYFSLFADKKRGQK